MTTTESTSVTADDTPNLYLSGPFAPVHEEVTVTDLEVTGKIPEGLDGRYLRNGPNPIAGDGTDPATYHWFTGQGMVHGIRLRDGRAEWYRNRWVRSRKVTDVLGEPFPHEATAGDRDYAANTSVIGHAGRTFALVEGGPRPYELTDELDTVGPCDFGGTLAAGYTAHPVRDPVSGELHAITYSMLGTDVTYSVLGTDGQIRHTVDIDVPGHPLMHSFALTENHIVLFDFPLTLDESKVAGATEADTLNAGLIPYTWNPDHQARVGIMPREGTSSDLRWFNVEPCYVFHPLNAYEERTTPGGPVDRIVLDVARFPTMFASSSNGPDTLATLDRWTIDFGTDTAHEERLDDRPQEFPRVDERLTGRPHRYGYSIALLQGALLKHDMAAKTTAVHTFDPGGFPSEFTFVPNADSSGEDDGVLMGFIERGATGRSDLVMLDAASLEPVATVHLPVRVPFGFHGNWVPA